MRAVALIGLVLALVIVGLLAKRQLSTIAAPVAPAGQAAAGAQPGDVRAQSQQIQQQFKKSLDAAMQQSQRVPDDQ
ncbi:hypothetical protein [Variovorax sp. PBL-E5]|uniref:hypothetical protein n=1 Tax=Variovorax sp. PBL-E5 TaxID=434014 RepID=UPI001315FDFF|nr:hypothetical protein [Variovorax sp. PBL-E5]VTU28704.1 hypothetical protein E5CHR_02663 [Variovorax sp. PBL-E5]